MSVELENLKRDVKRMTSDIDYLRDRVSYLEERAMAQAADIAKLKESKK